MHSCYDSRGPSIADKPVPEKLLLQGQSILFVIPQAGWGDLQAVDFHRDAELLYKWPPAQFDVKVSQ